MKILHTEASCGWGGQEIRILEESRGMIRRGHEVVVLCPAESRIYVEGPRRGVPTQAIPIGHKKLNGFLALRRWIEKNPVDVINTHSSTDSWLMALVRLSMRRRLPVVRTRHISAPIPKNFASRWLYSKSACHVITTGESLREQVISETGISPERVTSIPTGVDLVRYSPGDRLQRRIELGLPKNAALVAIVATLRSWKGHDHLFEAMARLDRRDVMLIVVGDGPRMNHLLDLSRKLALGDRVKFVGQQENVVPWFQAVDLAVLPSYANEGVPQSLMQAMACGAPVISTPVGAISELVHHGETGWLVPPADPDNLAKAISELLADSALRARLGSVGRTYIEKNYSMDSMLDRMENEFRTAVKSCD